MGWWGWQDDDTHVKLADFGLAHALGGIDGLHTICGTPSYMSPEVVSRKPYTEVSSSSSRRGRNGREVFIDLLLMVVVVLLASIAEQKTDCWSVGVVSQQQQDAH